jgi:leucyl aminopeptidase
MELRFHSEFKPTESSVIVIGMFQDGSVLTHGNALSQEVLNLVAKAAKSKDFKAKPKDIMDMIAPVDIAYNRIIVIGLGEKETQTDYDLQAIGGAMASALLSGKEIEGFALLSALPAHQVALIAAGASLRSWSFDKYFTTEKTKSKRAFKSLHVCFENGSELEASYADFASITEGVFLTRDVVSELPNILYPETFCDRAKELRQLGVEVEILGEDDMKELGMNSLLAVGQGSVRESKLCVMRWNGGKADSAPLAFVGKGVTFDSGGISIKPSDRMHEMKYDMAGAGVVLGLMKALASRKAKVNVVCVAGLAENMPSGNAQRPGDVWVSMSGQTIECQNTDAEGRMVLADALWYTQDRFKPQFMVDLATLTGAIVVALGKEHAGLFSNNDELAERLFNVGQTSGEKVWRMPLGEPYDRAINSTVADMKNVGDPGTGGSITAAQFLQRFVNKYPWAHLDIAGMAWADKSHDLCSSGASGFGVRLLDQLVSTYYEGK